MSLFRSKNYAKLVAPLKKMVDDLQEYMDSQNDAIVTKENQKAAIDVAIQEFIDRKKTEQGKLSQDVTDMLIEIKKSKHTKDKINDLISLDLDGNGILDSDELPTEEE